MTGQWSRALSQMGPALAAVGFVLGACSGPAAETPPAVASTVPPLPAASASASAAGQRAGASTSTSPAPQTLPAAASEGRVQASPAPVRAAEADTTAELRAEVIRLIGSAACRDDRQCRALPVGSKPCGGPEAYLAWSTSSTDARSLEAAALRYRQAREARNQRLGLMSDCALVTAPAVRCVASPGADSGRCETVRGPAGTAIR